MAGKSLVVVSDGNSLFAQIQRTVTGRFSALLSWLMTSRTKPLPAAPVSPEEHLRRMGFTYAVIALAARLTRCNGVITREEFIAFRELFPLEDEESRKLRQIFSAAWEDAEEVESFARRIPTLYPEQPKLWKQVLTQLAAIAAADGPYTMQERNMLSRIGGALKLRQADCARILAHAMKEKKPDPLDVLGLERRAATEQVKAHYHALMRSYHPDRIPHRFSYPEAQAVAQKKAREYTAAYKQVVG